MKSLRVLIPSFVLLLAFAAWGVWWSIVADGFETAIAAYADESRARGIDVTYDSLEIDGFPFRVTASFGNLRVAGPDGLWQADSFAVDVLPYNFEHFVFRAEGSQHFETRTADGTSTLDVAHVVGLGSLLIADGQPARIDMDLRGAKVRARDALGYETAFDARRLQAHALRSVVAGTMAPEFELAVSADSVTLLTGIEQLLGRNVGAFSLRGTAPGLHFADIATPQQIMAALQGWLARGGRLHANDVRLVWGGVDVTGGGELGQDSLWRLDGRFDLKIKGYRTLLDALARAGYLAPNDASLTAGVGDVLSGASGGYAPVPLMLSDGVVYLGPARIGALAPLR